MHKKIVGLVAGAMVLLSASSAAIMPESSSTSSYVPPVSALWTQTEPGDWGSPFGVHFQWATSPKDQPDHFLIQQKYYPKSGKPVYQMPYRLASYINSKYISTNDMQRGEKVVFSIAACISKDQCSAFITKEYIVGSNGSDGSQAQW